MRPGLGCVVNCLGCPLLGVVIDWSRNVLGCLWFRLALAWTMGWAVYGLGSAILAMGKSGQFMADHSLAPFVLAVLAMAQADYYLY